MKKRLSHFAYNQRSRSGWTLSIPPVHIFESNLIDHKKTVTYVPGTFVTLLSGPHREDEGGGWNDLNYLNGWNSDDLIATDSKGSRRLVRVIVSGVTR